MGIEVAHLLVSEQWSLLAETFSLARWLSVQFGINISNREVFWALLGVAFLLLVGGLLSMFRQRPFPDDVMRPEDDDLLGRVALLERKVHRLSERTDSLDERVRVEVTSMGRTMSTILARIDAGLPIEKSGELTESPVVRSRSVPEIESRQPSLSPESPKYSHIGTSRGEQVSLTQRLVASRRGILNKIKSVFAGYPSIDGDMLEELEVLLVTSDLGLKTASSLLRELKATVREGRALSKEDILGHLHRQLLALLDRDGVAADAFDPFAKAPGEPKVVVIVGVNGVGKTTTVAKLAHRCTSQGARVVLAAADTFRAAADEQLREWGRRVGVQVVTGAPDDKPSTVAHAAVELARRERADLVLVDTAGRLHNRGSLMQELEGMVRAVKKLQPNSPEEVWLVIDGTTGQNAIVQAREFQSSVPLSGVIVTKLDGTAKGGVVVAVTEELGIPVRFIGVGETWDDLRPFDSREFVTALLGDGTLSSIDS